MKRFGRLAAALGVLIVAAGCSQHAGTATARPTAAPPSPSTSTRHDLAPKPAPSPKPGAVTPIKAPAAEKLDSTDEFGLITSVAPAPDGGAQIAVDRVDMLSGAEAEAAAKAHGQDSVRNDYFLVNDNPLLRRYRIAPDAIVWASIALNRRGPELTRSTLPALYRFLRTDAAKTTLFHLQVHGGSVIGIEEQYRP